MAQTLCCGPMLEIPLFLSNLLVLLFTIASLGCWASGAASSVFSVFGYDLSHCAREGGKTDLSALA